MKKLILYLGISLCAICAHSQEGHKLIKGTDNVSDAISITLYAPDLEKASHFYQNVLGLTRIIVSDHPNFYTYRAGSFSINLIKGKTKYPKVKIKNKSSVYVIALSVKDIQSIKKVLDHNKIDYDFYEGAGADWIMVKDPGGNIIELAKFHEVQ